jgi:hypothetical protein
LQPGVPCRFRFTDGRWYHGLVEQLQQPTEHTAVTVSFAYPTR